MITLCRRDIPSILDALLMIDGDPKAPFVYEKPTRYALTKALRLLTQKFKDIERHRLGIIRELAPQTFELKEGTPEALEFTKRWEEYEAASESMPILLVKRSALNIHDPKNNPDGNKIPIAVLAKLEPLIVEDDV